MSHISTLIPDIQKLITRKDGWFHEEFAERLSTDIGVRLREQFNQDTRRPTLRLSQMGPKCPHALWCSINTPELAETLPPWAEVKFAFGHILEALVLPLAKAAGHRVEGEQDAVYLDGITGHRDCVIDGCLVDVKSAASRSFQKFKDGSLRNSDSFGYLDQLDGYMGACLDDPLVTVKDKAYLFAIDKQLGHMVLYEHTPRIGQIRERISYYKEIVGRASPPPCECGTVPDGKSGNIGLDVKASYSPWKYCCFPNLRTFLYSDGPRYLTTVVKRPKRQDGSLITEVDRAGNVVYN